MNDSNYYIPDISEFNVGFRYESLYKGEWVDSIFSINHKLCNEHYPTMGTEIMGCLHRGEIRVKYLDAEDIVDCGWALLETCCYQIKLDGHEYDNLLELFFRHGWTTISQGDVVTMRENWSDRFSGILKNKSELKKIMKLLNITE